MRAVTKQHTTAPPTTDEDEEKVARWFPRVRHDYATWKDPHGDGESPLYRSLMRDLEEAEASFTRLVKRLRKAEALVEHLDSGGYPRWAFSKAGSHCSCRQDPCICFDPEPEIDVVFRQMEERLRELEHDNKELKPSCRLGHYCPEWDEMWVHEGMEAFDACQCTAFGKGRDSLPTRLRELMKAGSRLSFVIQHTDNPDKDERTQLDNAADEFRAVFWPKPTPG